MFKHWRLAVVAASLLIGGVAVAQPTVQGGSAHHWRGKRDGQGGRQRRAAMIAKFDANKDGKLDATERAAMQKEKFAKLDKNHDGVLSFDEAQPLFKHGGRQRGADAGNKQR